MMLSMSRLAFFLCFVVVGYWRCDESTYCFVCESDVTVPGVPIAEGRFWWTACSCSTL